MGIGLTTHARERLAERFPLASPKLIVDGVKEAILAGSSPEAISADGAAVYAVGTPSGSAFAVVSQDGSIITILEPGMEVTTSTGRHTLPGEPNKIAGNGADAAYAPPDDTPAPLAHGVHRIPEWRYHADPCERPSLSSSLVSKLLDSCPAKVWREHPRLGGASTSPTAIMDLGSAFHTLTLGRGEGVAVYPDNVLSKIGAITQAAKEWAAERRADGMIPMKSTDADKASAMADAMTSKLRAAGIAVDPAHSELVAIAEIDGVMSRAMIDYAPPGEDWILDLKSQENANPDTVGRHLGSMNYDARAAHYLQVWNAATGEKRTRVRFGLCERGEPHLSSVVEMFNAKGDSADWMEDAHEKAAAARALWGRCLAEDDWPDYGDGVFLIGAPHFHRRDWAERGADTSTAPPDNTERNLSPEAIETARRFMSPEGFQ